MKKIASLLLATAILCCGAPRKSKLSDDLKARVPATDDGKVRVIIQWDPAGSASVSQKISDLGGTTLSEYKRIKGGTYLLPPSALDTLADDPDVKFISADRKVRRKLANAAAAIGAPTVWKAGFNGSGIGVAVIDSGMNPDGNLGGKKGIAYAEDFTGFFSNSNPGHRPEIRGGGKSNDAPDWFGHGQHIAGIIASNAASSTCLQCTSQLFGMAPGSSLINLKVLDGEGQGNDSDVIAAIDRAIDLKDKYNIRVINLSLGRPVVESYKDDPLCQAVEAAWKAGIVIVVSAGNEGRDNSFGNEGYGTITSPGNDPYVITVGAMKTMGTPQTADDLIASYSSKGPTPVDHIVKPDILAPGNQIVSLRARNSRLPLEMPANIALLSSYQVFNGTASPANQPDAPSDPTVQPADARIGFGYSPNYFTLSGTSMAAAVVSGAVADLLQAAPSLTPDQIKMLLMKTSTKSFPDSSTVFDAATGTSYTSYYDIFTVGAGYMNLSAALDMVKQVPSDVTALSPAAAFDFNTGDVSLVLDPSSVFSDRALWGTASVNADRALWGTNFIWSNNVLSDNRALWGSRAMWGTSTTDAQRAMWGTSTTDAQRAMWGTSTTDAQRAMWGTSTTDAQRAMWGTSAIWSNRALWGTSATTQSESVLITGEK